MRGMSNKDAYQKDCPISRKSCLCVSCMLWNYIAPDYGSCILTHCEFGGGILPRFDEHGNLLVKVVKEG